MSESSPALRPLAQDLWVVERPQRFYGLEVGTRMTVLRLADGSLLLHSAVELDAALRRELDAIGRVRFAVAPNRVHHLCEEGWPTKQGSKPMKKSIFAVLILALFGTGFAALAAEPAGTPDLKDKARPIAPCCNVVAINQATGS